MPHVLGRVLKVVPILHPSFILRGQWGLEPAQIHYLRIVKALMLGQHPGPPDVSVAPPGTTLAPTLADVHRFFLTERHELQQGCSVDIECAGKHLLCVGFCRLVDRAILVLPFRGEGGATYWHSLGDLRSVVSILYSYLADPALNKVFQNGQAFDIPYLQHMGFRIEGYDFDTMLAQHLLYPEMPKSLQFLGNLYLGMPKWKDSLDDGEGK